ncbi:prefoldin subunit alpha [Candidatus Pacearchaeota archaeon]|nr:prefoldin subunit alpha [Candidatus Pacearchaeota archaeon]
MKQGELNSGQQQAMMEIQILHQRGKQLEAQIEVIGRQVSEMYEIAASLKEIDKNPGKEALLPVGKGIFLKSKIGNNKSLLLNIGSGVVIEKSIKEAKELVEKQAEKLEEMRKENISEMDNLSGKIDEMVREMQK